MHRHLLLRAHQLVNLRCIVDWDKRAREDKELVRCCCYCGLGGLEVAAGVVDEIDFCLAGTFHLMFLRAPRCLA